MSKAFEDEFMDAQSSVISLCLELLSLSDEKADKVFAYIFQNDMQDSINAAFGRDGEVFWLNDWFTDEQIDDFFDRGIEDVENIIDICQEYEKKCPNTFKLVYDIKTKSLDANYGYSDLAAEGDVGIDEDFLDWVKASDKGLALMP